jgi:tetratricopeptide (TPR) repeat protein
MAIMKAGNPQRFGKKWLLVATLAVLVLAAAAVFFLVLPRVPAVKSWRSNQLARKAVEAMDAADWARAQAKTIASFQLDPQNPNALRASARLNDAAGMPQALGFYRSLLATGQATGDDYLHYADSLLRAGSYPPFLAAVTEAGNRLPGDPRVRLLLARYAVVAGDWSAVSNILQEILNSDQASDDDKSLAAQILLSVPVPEGRQPAAKWILDHPAGKTSKLLDSVLANPGVPEELRKRAASALENLPGRRFDGRIEVAASRLRSTPGDKEQVFAGLLREAKTPDDRRALASFFVRAGENQRALDLLPLATARTRKDFFLVWLDASAGLGRWDEVMNVLKTGPNPLEPALRDLYIARCYEALGQETSAGIYFERAARTPTEDRDLLFYLAGYFHQRDRLSLAEIVLRRLTNDPLASRSAYEALLNIFRFRGNSAGLLGVLEEMSQRWPKDPAVANDRNYLLLLLDRDISRTLERCRVLERENPDLFPLKMTRALALLRARRAAEGLEIFQDSLVQFGQLLPGQKAVFSALLEANGLTDAAASVRAELGKAQLLPEERALITK